MVLESDIVREGTKGYELAARSGRWHSATLQASLTARLDRLSTVKGTAQLGATLGREFSRQLLAAVSPLTEAGSTMRCASFAAGLLQEQPRGVGAKQPRGTAPETTYTFRHALIQDAAYQSLLKRRRRQVHRQIAATMRDRYPEIAETQPEVLAHHFEEAGLVPDAIAYRQSAGQRAAARSSHVEAVSHLSRALDLLLTRPEKPERDRQELLLRISVGVELIATKSTRRPTSNATVFAPASCAIGWAPPQLFPCCAALLLCATRADFPAARGLAEQRGRARRGSALLVEASKSSA
jgi:predicted ATPase